MCFSLCWHCSVYVFLLSLQLIGSGPSANMLWAIWITSSLVASGLAAPAASPRVLHEKRATPAHVTRRRVEPGAIIPVRVGLKQSNLDSGYERLMEVSHPSSPTYGKHLSAEEVHSIFAPAEEALETVKEVGGGQTEFIHVHYSQQSSSCCNKI